MEKDAEARKELILTAVGAVLFLVPLVGEQSAMMAGMADLARAIFMLGETANLAYGVYTIVDGPKSAPMGVICMMLGVGVMNKAVRDFRGFGRWPRRGLS
jgi:hypothetical protein